MIIRNACPACGSTRFAQFISICRWLQLVHKDQSAPLEHAPFCTPWARKRYRVAQRFHQYLRATNCYKLSESDYQNLQPVNWQREKNGQGENQFLRLTAPSWVLQGGFSMHRQHTQKPQGVRRRELLRAGLAAGVTLSAWPLSRPPALWGAEAGQPRRGGILRVRGWDPPHFDPHLTISNYTHSTLSLIYSRLVRHKAGPEVQPGTFPLEPDLADRWEAPDETTYIFHLRHGGTGSV